jgi:hypothetical protein
MIPPNWPSLNQQSTCQGCATAAETILHSIRANRRSLAGLFEWKKRNEIHPADHRRALFHVSSRDGIY